MTDERMSMCVLGSGSAGNCTVIALHEGGDERAVEAGVAKRGGTRHMLVDLGISPRQTNQRLSRLGLSVGEVGDVLVTHLDWDHLHPSWVRVLRKLEVRVHVHEMHLKAVRSAGMPMERVVVHEGGIELEGGGRVRAARLAHDEEGSVGFVIEHGGAKLGFATDLGQVSVELLEMFSGLDAVALESNYDLRMQVASARPVFLKERIMGGRGHLSNEESLEAVKAIAARSALQHVVLLHLSRECNCPAVVRRLYAERAPELEGVLTVSSQHSPTGLLGVRAGGRVCVGEMSGAGVGYQMRMFG